MFTKHHKPDQEAKVLLHIHPETLSTRVTLLLGVGNLFPDEKEMP